MEITSVIIKPLLTEKTQKVKLSDNPKMSFVVNLKANKKQIAYAFFSLFGIKALSVNTIVKKPQPTRVTKFGRNNFSKATKVAYISVSKDNLQQLQEMAAKEIQSQENSKISSETESVEESTSVTE